VLLDGLLASFDRAAHRKNDPVDLVHGFTADADREVAGLVASSLAFGNVVSIRRSVRRVLDALGPSPSAAIDALSYEDLRDRLGGFVHRVYRGPDVARMLAGAAELRRQDGSIGDALDRHFRETHGDVREAFARLADRLRGPRPSRGLRHLVPDPRAGSACKRLMLYARWMSRPADGVDLGVWPFPAARLVIPLDTHVHRIAKNLSLTRRNDASWRTAEEITSTLRRFDPDDPVKYDFAICHLGVSRACPSRRDPVVCDRCALRPICIRW
jgi:uncharacterized protein (TIGR02757 family)